MIKNMLLNVKIEVVNSQIRNRCYIAYSMLEEKHDNMADLGRDIQQISLGNFIFFSSQ